MIHICRVDIGCRYVFDMVADNIDDVSTLKSAIEKHNGINVSDQILLISGGEVLKNNRQKLFGLSAGIEESPIYLLDSNNIKKPNQTIVDLNQLLYSCTDRSKDIESAVNLQPSYQTLQLRTQLAYDIYDCSIKMNQLCETYYYDQFWQYQGYLAIIANLDEVLISFRLAFDKTKEQYLAFSSNKEESFKVLNEIESYIKLLKASRLLPQIADHAQNVQLFNSFCSQTKLTSSVPVVTPDSAQAIENLYDWTNSTDQRHQLDVILIKAKESINCLNDEMIWKQLEENVLLILNEPNHKQMREIEGLTKRLCDLNSFLDKCKICLARQKEVADSFKQHQISATKLKDDTILHDLCKGHEKHLDILKDNHLQMLDMTRKIAKAKIELTRVINSRLNTVMNMQTNLIGDYHMKLVMYAEQIIRINRYLKQIEQLKNAPEVYVLALNETLRREKFSSLYKNFSRYIHQVSNDLCRIEIEKRDQFNKKFLHNYIANLFPYLQEKKPIEFIKSDLNLNYDVNIPQLNEQDVRGIEKELSDYLTSKDDLKKTAPQHTTVQKQSEQEKYYLNLIDTLNKFLSKSLSSIQKAQKTNEIYLSDEQIIQQSTDNILTNDDLILISTKPSANAEFLKKLNKILDSSITDLQKSLVNDNNKLKSNLNEFNLNLQQLNVAFIELTEKKNVEKSFIYNKILENLFSTKSSQPLSSSESNNDQDNEEFERLIKSNKTDEDFFLSLKENLLKLRQTYEKSIDDTRRSVELYKKSINADRQRYFNEAVQRIVNEKEKLEIEFKLKEDNYIKELKEKDEKLLQFTSLIDKEDAIQRQMQREQRLMDKIHCLEKQLHKFTLSASTSSLIASTQQQSADVGLCANMSSSPSCQTIKSKNEEVIELNSCYTGDLVIAIYDNSHNAYRIINKSSPYKHFIHSDSLKILESNNPEALPISTADHSNKNLTSSPLTACWPTSPKSISPPVFLSSSVVEVSTIETVSYNNLQSLLGNAIPLSSHVTTKQPSWFVARVCSKEFCVAKKENNRYKVPANTRFYRVRIEPYKL